MPPADGTRSQAQVQAQERALYDRLLRRATTVRPSDAVATVLASVAKTTLELYPLETTERPPRNEIRSLMTSLLPAPAEIFTESFIRSPLFPVFLLRDVASLYGCGATDITFANSLNLTTHELTNDNIMAHVWFAYFAGCDSTTAREVVECYKRTKGSASMPFTRRAEMHAGGMRATSQPPPNVGISRQQQITQVVPRQGDSLQNMGPADTQQHGMRNTSPGSVHPQSTSQSHGQDPQLVGNQPGENGQAPPDGPSPHSPEDYDDYRKANYVHQYFKDRKFTGEITQSIHLLIRDYSVCARQHRLSRAQLADYFVNVLEGPARTFFFNNARNDMSFDDMAEMMVKEYNSDARQLQVQGTLEILRLDKYMTEHEITDVSDGLTKIVNLIENLTPQCQPQFRSDSNKIVYLRKAVLGHEWAKGPISNIISSRYSFNGFVTALRESIQLQNELSLVTTTPDATHISSLEDTHYQQYGRLPKFVRKHNGPQRNNRSLSRGASRRQFSRSFEESRRRSECHKCGEHWHPGHRCRSGAIRDYVRERLKSGEASVHIVSDLVSGLEGELAEQVEREGEDVIEKDSKGDGDEIAIRFQEPTSELALFDLRTTKDEAWDTKVIEEIDKEQFSTHLSASMAQQEPVGYPGGSQDF